MQMGDGEGRAQAQHGKDAGPVSENFAATMRHAPRSASCKLAGEGPASHQINRADSSKNPPDSRHALRGQGRIAKAVCTVVASAACPVLMFVALVFAGSAGAQAAEGSADSGICGRTEQVRTAIVAKIADIDDCSAVTDAHLGAITGTLHLSGAGISSLRGDDFSGLTGMTALDLSRNQLTTLPAGVFSGLTSLRRLQLENNRLRTLPAGVFDGLAMLFELRLYANQLEALRQDAFAGLGRLGILDLEFNSLSTLPSGVFSGFNLIFLGLEGNKLETLTRGMFAGLDVEVLDLSHNGTRSVSADAFSRLTSLNDLDLEDNKLNALPPGVFDGLTNLRYLWLKRNPGANFTFTMTLERISGTNKVVVKVPRGAPFDMTTTISATGGSLPAGVSSVTVPTGRTTSGEITIVALDGATVALGSAPAVPSAAIPGTGGVTRFTGVAAAVSGPVTFGTGTNTNTPPTGLPVITGTARVGETLTASVDRIADTDGLDNATFSYQWISSRGTDDTDIEGAAETSYELAVADAGRTVKVRVTFTDDGGTEETLDSAATATVAARAPDAPRELAAATAKAREGELDVSWEAPESDGGDAVTGYKVQWKSGTEAYDGSASSTRQAAVSDPAVLSHRIAGLAVGTAYTVRVIAVNAAGDGAAAEVAATAQDRVAPALVSASVNGMALTLTFSEVLDQDSAPPANAFAVSVAGAARTVDDVAISGSAVALTLASAVASGETVTVGYTVPTGADAAPLRDGSDNAAAGFTGKAVDHTGSTGTETIQHTDGVSASFPQSADASTSHSGADDRPRIVVAFGKPVSTFAADTPSAVVTGGTVTSVQAHTAEADLANAWLFIITPDGNDDVTFTLIAGAACDDGGICAADGTTLSDVPATRTLPGPEEPEEQTPLSASFDDAPASHDGTATFTFDVEFSEAPQIGYKMLRDHAFSVSGGSVKFARRAAPPSNLEWQITVEPSGNDDITIELATTSDCDATGAICTAGGTPLTQVPGTLTIPGPGDTQIETPLTASFAGMPAEHAGPGQRFTFELSFSEAPKLSYKKLRDRAFTVTGGNVRSARRLQAPSNIRWEITVEPSGWENVGITLPGGRACTVAGGICTADGTALSNSPSTAVRGPAALFVADARADEGTGATLDFAVILDHETTQTVTVQYATTNGTATAGEDFTATSGTLNFAPGDVAKTVFVPILDDAKDEGEETMTLVLSNATNIRIVDPSATGTIVNSDPLQQAWIVRFGRTVASQVVDGITERLESSATGSEIRIAGVTLEQDGTTWTEVPRDEAEIDGFETLEGQHTISARDAIMQSAFRLQGSTDARGGAAWTASGRFSSASFEGETEGVRLSGDVTTGLLGADIGTDTWIAGVALSSAKGDGPFTLTGDMASNRKGGTVESALTSIHPYAQIELTERVALWGVGGYGAGYMTIAEDGGTPITTDIDMTLAAVGVRGKVLAASHGDAVDLAVKSDALWLRTTSDATAEMVAAEADVTRLRLMADTSRTFETAGGGTLTPRLEAGVRHDGGDAEEGTGLEFGAGLRYQGAGVTIEGAVRTLIAHEDNAYEEWGASAAVRIGPGTSGRGLSLSVSPTWGNAASEAEQHWSARDPSGLVRCEDFEDESRLDAELGYGVGGRRGIGVLTPYTGLTLGDGGTRTLRTGARWTIAPETTVSLDATREERSGHETQSDALMLRASMRF